jgi:hypothetical protein
MDHHRGFYGDMRNFQTKSRVEFSVYAARAKPANERGTDIKPVSFALIKRRASTRNVMAFNHQDPSISSRQFGGSGQSRDTRSNDGRIVCLRTLHDS